MIDWDEYDTRKRDRERAAELIEKVRSLTVGSVASCIKQSKEQIEAQNELDEFRKKCWHDWELVILFQYTKKLCKICQKEDLNHKES